jgi:threonine dehydratase
MVKKNAEKWGKKVRIIGVSMDENKQTAHDHCVKNGWMDVEHYHHNDSDCSDVYNV